MCGRSKSSGSQAQYTGSIHKSVAHANTLLGKKRKEKKKRKRETQNTPFSSVSKRILNFQT